MTTLIAAAAAASPPSALAVADRDSVTTDAEIRASVFDDGGSGAEDSERAALAGWSEFDRSVSARFSRSSGRAATASASQKSRIVDAGADLFGFDSRGAVRSTFTGAEPDDGIIPETVGESEVTFGFEVVGSPVEFALTGELDHSVVPGSNPAPPRVLVVSPSGTVHLSDNTTEIDETGQLAPGTHQLTIEARASEGAVDTSSGSAAATYDVQLRFCTETMPESGILVGTEGDDVLCGSAESDLISGRGGEDTIFAAGDGDGVVGGAGSDEIFGDDGDDFQLYGGPGNDVIDAGPGSDGTGAGADSMVAGGPGDDELIGGPGADRIAGRCLELVLGTPSPVCPEDPPGPAETDDDNLIGEQGNDFLFGDGGFNLIRGGPGNDVTSADGPSVFVLAGGNDTALGSSGHDEIEGGSGRDDLSAEGGADCADGGSGRDDIEGNGGNDKLIARDGARDRVNGGPGPDRGRFDSADRVISVARVDLRGGC